MSEPTPMPDDDRHAEIVRALGSLTPCSSCGAMGAAPCALAHMGADLCPDCAAQAEDEDDTHTEETCLSGGCLGCSR